MRGHTSILIGSGLAILGVAFGGVSAFIAFAAAVPPGEELGLAGAAGGIGCGLACAAIGVIANRVSRSRERDTRRGVAA